MTIEIVVNSAAVLLLIAAAAMWARAAARLRDGQPLLPPTPLLPVPWGLVDLVWIALLILVCESSAVLVTTRFIGIAEDATAETLTVDELGILQTAACVARVVALVSIIVGLAIRTGAGLRHLGLVPFRFEHDTQCAGAAFLLVGVPSYVVQGLLSLWMPSEHPIINLLRDGASPWFWIVAGASAVIVAPLMEEFTFRVILQGWLQKVADRGGSHDEILYGEPPQPQQEERNPPPAMWPLVVSSAMFAALHMGHGPDPIPIFLLSMGLGYLYQRTGRIWPSLLLHALFNATSLAMLWLSLAVEG